MNAIVRTTLFLAGIGLALAACRPTHSGRLARSSVERNTNPGVAESEILGLAEANSAFALDLLQQLGDREGNLVFSPYSLSSALAMAYAGARGETESQMASALHFELPQSQLHSAFNQLELSLARPTPEESSVRQPLQLEIANSIWNDARLVLRQDFLDLIASNYGEGIHLVDFVEAFEAARREINDWVSGQTEGRIRDLVPDGAVDATTRMVLVNAIFFKGDWQHPFDPNDTSPRSFHLPDGREVSARMMYAHLAAAAYASGPGFQAVQLPYEGATAAMTIIVPDSGGFDAFEARFDHAALARILADLEPVSLELGLPKFTFRSSFDLGEHLAELGMSDAFDSQRADFSGMTGRRDLYVSTVLHQAAVAVDEKGTEAAAATAVIIAPTSILLPDRVLLVDRPFIFVITDVSTRQILFLGRVLDPTA